MCKMPHGENIETERERERERRKVYTDQTRTIGQEMLRYTFLSVSLAKKKKWSKNEISFVKTRSKVIMADKPERRVVMLV